MATTQEAADEGKPDHPEHAPDPVPWQQDRQDERQEAQFRRIPRVEPARWLPPDGGASDLDVSAGAGDRTLGGRTGRHACKELLGPLPHDDDFVVDEPVVKLEPLDEQLRVFFVCIRIDDDDPNLVDRLGRAGAAGWLFPVYRAILANT